jgi:peptide/nickel transport system permease protein
MAAAILRRFGWALILLLVVLSGAFALLEALPGDAAAVFEDPRVPPAQHERLRAVYGLDRPAPERFIRFLAAAVRGDWGYSFAFHRPVSEVLGAALPWTLTLALAALALEFGLGVPLGLWAARRAGSATDHALRAGALAIWTLPSFWLGLLLLLVFAFDWRLLPPGGVGSPGAESWPLAARALDLLRHLALPAAALGLPAAAATARFVRASLLEVAGEGYLLAARARGLAPRRVVWVHALRAAASPVLQLFGLSLASLLSGSLAVEVVFGWPGLGRVTFEALAARDQPVLLAGATLAAATVLAGSLIAELAHLALDPRVRRA